jgi:hypothetical protein
VVVYFMTNLARTAGAFFSKYLLGWSFVLFVLLGAGRVGGVIPGRGDECKAGSERARGGVKGMPSRGVL